MKILNHMEKRWFVVDKKAESTDGTISLYNDIGLWGISMQDFDAELKRVEDAENLTVRINSYGGEVFVGIGIRSRLQEHKAKNKTMIIDGVAASIAGIIALTPGFKLSVYRNAFFMMHKPSSMVGGTAEDMRKEADLLDKIQVELLDTLKAKTNGKVSEEELNEMMNATTWLTGKELYDMGIADVLLDEDTENDEPETNSLNKLPENMRNVFLNQLTPKPKGGNMPKCPHCGKEHDKDAVFCSSCGGRIVALATPPAAATASAAEKAELIAAERKRINSITAHCGAIGLPMDFIQSLVASGETLDEASEKIVAKVKELKPLTPAQPNVTINADARDKYRNQASLSIQMALGHKLNAKDAEDIRKNPGPTDFHGLVRNELLNEGKLSPSTIANMGANELGSQAIRVIKNALGTSDLPNILADTINKSFMMTPTEAGATFDQVCATAETPDFRTTSFTKLSAAGDIDEIPEGGSFKNAGFSDAKEQMALKTYGKAITIPRQAIVNNDVTVLNTIPRRMIMATYLKANRLCYDLLTSNALAGPTLLEGGALFLAAKGNIVANGSFGTVGALNAVKTALSKTKLLKADPKDPDSFVTGTIRKILVGTDNEILWQQLTNSQYDPGSNKFQVFNPFNGVSIVADPYLQSKLTAASKANAFYGFADPTMFPTLTALYLTGNRTPSVRSEPSAVGESLGITWDFLWDIAFGFQDWRGIIYSDGVTPS
jgi:ATP-dependent protease ClpP protease subunit